MLTVVDTPVYILLTLGVGTVATLAYNKKLPFPAIFQGIKAGLATAAILCSQRAYSPEEFKETINRKYISGTFVPMFAFSFPSHSKS
eukprot:492768-Amorphochlora_amoeboformis.AAC.1